MDPATISAALAGLNLVSGMFGASSASKARKRAEQARTKALSDYMVEADRSLQSMKGQNARALWSATGQGGDALRALGGQLGSALAAAGVYNSSATAGALAKGQNDLGASLLDLAQRNAASEANVAGENRRFLYGQQLGFAGGDMEMARANEADSKQNVLQGLLTLGTALGGIKQKAGTTKAAAEQATPSVAGPVQAPKLTLGGLQSDVQRNQFDLRSWLGLGDGRSYGPLLNGLQGSKLTAVGLRRR